MSSLRNNFTANSHLSGNLPVIGEWNGGPQLHDDTQSPWMPSTQAHRASYNVTQTGGDVIFYGGEYITDVYHETTYISPNQAVSFPHDTSHSTGVQYSTVITTSQVELGLPSHQKTEQWLRNHLKIPAPQPLNLWCLQNLTNPTKLPNLTDMIFLAIWGSPYKRLGLSEIFRAIENRYPALITHTDKAWQRSIRHRLSLKACFVRVRRDKRGGDWMLDISKGLQNGRSHKASPPQGASGSFSGQRNQSGEDDNSPFMGYSSDSDPFTTPSPNMSSSIGDYAFMASDKPVYDHPEGYMETNFYNAPY